MYSSTQRLMRSRTDKMIAGVAGGIAQYLGIDPVLVRLAFVGLLFTGVGVLLYPVLWLVMPLEGSQTRAPQQAVAEMRQRATRLGEEIREVFVAPGSTPRKARFDPMTGQPLEEEGEIPVRNLQPDAAPGDATPADVQARRNRLLGFVLLTIGGIVLMTMVPGLGHLIGRLLFPALLIIVGVVLLRRHSA